MAREGGRGEKVEKIALIVLFGETRNSENVRNFRHSLSHFGSSIFFFRRREYLHGKTSVIIMSRVHGVDMKGEAGGVHLREF